ncbi:MAG TPA: hypothetical protein VNU22_13695 [Candidatus Acidoferrum sp.]|nr:hypothetical protein [Candidatus Acidoferrum sp.]
MASMISQRSQVRQSYTKLQLLSDERTYADTYAWRYTWHSAIPSWRGGSQPLIGAAGPMPQSAAQQSHKARRILAARRL